MNANAHSKWRIKMNKKGFTLVELLIVICIIAIVGAAFLGGDRTMGDGDRVGAVAKLSRKGIIFKTWEGQLILGGQGTVTTNTWDFSVTNDAVLDDLRKAMDSGKNARLSYHQNFFPRPWSGSTTYFIQKVTPLP